MKDEVLYDKHWFDCNFSDIMFFFLFCHSYPYTLLVKCPLTFRSASSVFIIVFTTSEKQAPEQRNSKDNTHVMLVYTFLYHTFDIAVLLTECFLCLLSYRIRINTNACEE